MNADGFRARRRHDIDMAVAADRQIQLADLVRFGQIGVEIVFAVKFVVARNLAVRRQTRRNGKLDDLFVRHRERAGHARADRTGMRVGRAAEFGGAAAENLRPGRQFDVHFKADHHFIRCHDSILLRTAGGGTPSAPDRRRPRQRASVRQTRAQSAARRRADPLCPCRRAQPYPADPPC